MPIFEPAGAAGLWQPSPLAAGPFKGLQGGAVAGLLTAEIEALAREKELGQAMSVSAWFLRPTPMKRLRTAVTVLHGGGRVSILDNTLWVDGESEACATVRVTIARERAVELPIAGRTRTALDPDRLPVAPIPPSFVRPWFMEAMEARRGEGIAWFRMSMPIIAGAGPLSGVLGPADWTHGIARPVRDVVADPNPDLTVKLARPPASDWIGVRPRTLWEADRGTGIGAGALLDVEGEMGSVSMAVVLLPLQSLLSRPAAA